MERIKNKSNILKYLLIASFLFVLIFGIGSIYASNVGGGFNPGYINNGDDVDAIKKPIDTIYSTILLILQIASVAGVLIAGLRYMYSSADTKADIKKRMIPLVIGLVLVFGATTIIQFVINASNELMTTPPTNTPPTHNYKPY